MSIRRAPRPESNFYLLDKGISEDPRLSWAARGMLIFLLGKPDHWEVSTAHLIRQTDDAGKRSGRDGVRAILKELIDCGYVTRIPARSGKGEFGGYDYLVSEVPQAANDDDGNPGKPSETPGTENPSSVAPGTDSPAPDLPAPANPPQVSIDIKTRTEEQQKISRPPNKKPAVEGEGEPEKFVEAMANYPKRSGSNPRSKALAAWNARVKAGVSERAMLEGVYRYLAYCHGEGKIGSPFVMQASRFFGPGKEYDEDWLPSQKPPKGGGFDLDRALDDTSWGDDLGF